ncbi:hypothetical protein V6Z12_D11G354800 [Gossypium hirsutum]
MALMEAKSNKLHTFDGLAITSSEAQPSMHTLAILVRSSGNDLSCLQLDNIRSLSLRSGVREAGMLRKLLPLRSRSVKEDRQKISLGIPPSRRLQSLSFNSLNELKLDNEGNIRGIFGRNLDDGPLHPLKDRILRFCN